MQHNDDVVSENAYEDLGSVLAQAKDPNAGGTRHDQRNWEQYPIPDLRIKVQRRSAAMILVRERCRDGVDARLTPSSTWS